MSGIIDASFLQQVVLIIIGVAASAVASVIGYYVRQYFKSRKDCFTALKEENASIKIELVKQDQRGIRQSRAIIAMAQRDDEITSRLHPNEIRPNSAAEVEKLLQDEYGNL